MTLYLKYRSKNLNELDSTNVRESLKKIVLSDNIPHAFLFAGPKGTGKTSAARILAKIINCENLGKDGTPCDKCDQCLSITSGNNLDVIEMDAASHRGIDDIRTLREAVKLSPTKAKKKIYIIDEAHMLTTEASNALLKTLEEPPSHVVFILATTNPEKLIGTIRSRVTFIPFKKATTEEIVRSLKRVVEGEKIKITDEALAVIAEHSDGAFRDAIKTLEQLIAEGKDLSKDFLEEYLFSKKAFDLDSFVPLLIKKDAKALLTEIGKFNENGVSADLFLESLLEKLRLSLLASAGIGTDETTGIDKIELVSLIELLLETSKNLSESPIEELPLEIAVIKWCETLEGEKPLSTHLKQNLASAEGGTGQSTQRVTDRVSSDLPQTLASDVREHVVSPTEMIDVGVNDEAWKSILALIKPINASIEALLRAARPVMYDGTVLTLGVYYKFHKERLEDPTHRRVLEDVVAQVLKSPTKVVCTLIEPPVKKVIEEAKVEPVLTEGADKDIIKAAEEIFSN